MKPSKRLEELGVTLPTVAAPIGSYVPAVRVGTMAYTSGQVPFREGKVVRAGKVPGDLSLADAADGARISALNAIAAIAGIAGGVDNIVRIVRVCVYVNSSPGFTDQPKVANGASDRPSAFRNCPSTPPSKWKSWPRSLPRSGLVKTRPSVPHCSVTPCG